MPNLPGYGESQEPEPQCQSAEGRERSLPEQLQSRGNDNDRKGEKRRTATAPHHRGPAGSGNNQIEGTNKNPPRQCRDGAGEAGNHGNSPSHSITTNFAKPAPGNNRAKSLGRPTPGTKGPGPLQPPAQARGTPGPGNLSSARAQSGVPAIFCGVQTH